MALSRKEREKLEELRKRGIKAGNYMKDMYGDLFGGRKPEGDSGLTFGDGTDSRTEAGSTSQPSAGRTAGRSGDSTAAGSSLDTFRDPLLQAQKALDEARKLFGDLPDLDKLQSEMPQLPTEKDLVEIDPSLMGDFGLPAAQGAKADTPALPTATAGSGPAPEPQPETPKEPERDPMEELDELIGLTKIKKDVRELADFAKIQKLRRDQGMKSVPVSLHLVFTGNPGTGKTTVARILGKLYKKIGILSKGQLIEVDRSGLVAGYVGQTALKTQDQIQKAMGGILFIDEAYALAQKDDAFGQEAIDTVLKAMEDHRDDLIVIVAGYTRPMEKFIESNPGLKSRFNKYIEFPDYTVDELEQIFLLNCRKYEYELDENVQKQVRAMIVMRRLERLENFANAREVRNLFEDIVTNQARRIAAMESPTPEDIRLIKLEDLIEEDETEEGQEAEQKEADKQKEKKETEGAAAPETEAAADSQTEEQSGTETEPVC